MADIDMLTLPIARDNDLEIKLENLSRKVQDQKRDILKKTKKSFPMTNVVGLDSNGTKSYSKKNGNVKTNASTGGSGGRAVGAGAKARNGDGGLGKRSKHGADGERQSQPAKKPKITSFESNMTSDEKKDWKQIKYEQKQLKEQRKKGKCGVELFQLSKEVKQMWEELRQKSCPKNRRASLSTKVFSKIQPFLKKIIYTHDLVRVVECLLTHGGQGIRDSIFNELKDDFIAFARDKYAHYFLIKMIKYCSKDQRKIIIGLLDGNVYKLLKSKFGIRVVEYAYNEFANASERARITQELYGPEFKVFKDDSCKNLDAILEKYPAKYDIIMKNLKEYLLKILPKEPWKVTLMHTLMADYITHADVENRAEFIDLIRNNLVKILHTRDGARVALECIWHGTAKDRKHIIKGFKTFVGVICREEYGHMVMLALFDCVDDTLLISKAILGDILASTGGGTEEGDLFLHKYGRKVIAYLIAPRNRAFFNPCVTEILEKGDGNLHTKKDMALKQEELRAFVYDKLLEKLEENLETYINNSSCVPVLLAILNYDKALTSNMTPIFQTLAKLLCVENVKNQSSHLACLKSLIANDCKQAPDSTKFGDILLDTLESNDNTAAFGWLSAEKLGSIFATMIESKAFDTKKIKSISAKMKVKI